MRKSNGIIDDDALGIHSGNEEKVAVDADYVTDDELDIIDWIEHELSSKLGADVQCSRSDDDCGDFVILNIDELIERLAFEDFQDKTDPGFES